MEIVCVASDPVIDKYLEPLKEIGNLKIFNRQNLEESEFVSLVKDADIIITGPEAAGILSESVLKQLPKLKYLSLLTVGFNWVDVEYARKINLPMSTVKGATAESVAEHIWGMILGLSKRINEFEREARFNGAFNFSLYKGREVFGKTLGVIGLGDIGKKVARIGAGFDMKVIGANKSGEKIAGVKLVSLSELLEKSDVISVCVPLNDETENMINSNEVEHMKDGVIIVNCAREKIVNKNAILKGIESGKVFGYGVETPIMQQIDKNDPYFKYPNVIVDPHNAFNTVESDIRTYNTVVDNIKSFIDGKPKNLIFF